jgi:hypothetical protein
MNENELAEKDLLTAQMLDKDNINVIHHLANVQEKLNKTESAIENYYK